MSTPIAMPEIFQSTRPIRGATNSGSITVPLSLAFQSTRPIRGATGWSGCASLHASAFQSTRPIRGATVGVLSGSSPGRYFNPRAPYGARRVIGGLVVHAVDISIHAPHTGRDFTASKIRPRSSQFQSTRPIRGATFQITGLTSPISGFQSTRPIRGATRFVSA